MEPQLRKRPFGVILLSLFHMVSGLMILAASCLAWAFTDKINFMFALLATPADRFISAGLIASVVLVISGVMMWRGDKWGYYVGSFHYLVGALQNLAVVLMLPLFLSSFYPNTNPMYLLLPKLFYSWYGIQGALQILIYLYFFKSSVREYFTTQEQNPWKFLLAELIVCLGLIIGGLIYTIIV